MDESDLLAGLAPALRTDLERRATRRRYATGEPLYRQGEVPGELLLLHSGRVKIWRATEAGGAFTLTMLGRGAVVGSFAAAAGEPSSVTATAVTKVEAIGWRLGEVRRMMAVDPALSSFLLGIVARHGAAMIQQLEELAAVPVEQRLARLLLRAVLPGEIEDELPLSRQDLADLVFSTLPTVSRIMSRWRADGLVDGGRGRVRLLDRTGLAAVAAARDAAARD